MDTKKLDEVILLDGRTRARKKWDQIVAVVAATKALEKVHKECVTTDIAWPPTYVALRQFLNAVGPSNFDVQRHLSALMVHFSLAYDDHSLGGDEDDLAEAEELYALVVNIRRCLMVLGEEA